MLDTTIGPQPLDSFPYVFADEGSFGLVPIGLYLRLLHSWPRDVPHDGEGRIDGVAFLESVRGPAIPVGRYVHVFGIAAGFFFYDCFARGFVFRPAAGKAFL